MKLENKKKFFKVFLIVIIFIVIILTVYMVYYSNINNEEGKVIGEPEFGNNPGGLDRNNLENAKIENGKKINVSKKLKKDREYNGLLINNIVLESSVGVSKFTATLNNNSNEVYKAKTILLKFIDKNKNEIDVIDIYVSEILPNDSYEINTYITSDIINAEDFIIETVQ